MSAMNLLVIQGNLTREPEIKYLPGGKVVVNCAIANNQRVGEQDKPCFLEFSIWGKQAEALANHTHKGSQIILQGRLGQEFWQDRHTGQQRSKHVLYAQQFSFCGSKSQTPTTQAPVVTTTTPLGPSQAAPMAQQAAVGAPIAPMAPPAAQVPVTAQQAVPQAQVAPMAAPHTVVATPQQAATAATEAGAPVVPMAAPTATTPAEMVQQLHNEIITSS